MLKRFFVPVLASSCLLSAAACGDDGGGGGGGTAAPFQATQSDDQVINTMSEADKQAFCQQLASYFQSQVSEAQFTKLICYSLALAFSGGDAAACNATATDCVSDPETSGSFEKTSCDTSEVADCTATVSEMEACYTALASQFKSAAASISCSSSPSQLEALDQKPAQCVALEAKCPTLFADEDDVQPPE